MNIFIYRKGALGDTISFIPFLFSLRKYYKKIYFAGNYLYRDLFYGISFINFLDADSKDILGFYKGKTPNFLSHVVDNFVFFSHQNEFFDDKIRFYKPLPDNLWFYEYPYRIFNLHFEKNNIYLPIINFYEFNEITNSSFFIIHPGSGGIKKVWSLERFFAIEDFLKKYNINTIYLLGESEERYLEKMKGRKFFYNLSLKKLFFC